MTSKAKQAQKKGKIKPTGKSAPVQVMPHQWHHFDAAGKVVGRLATEVAQLLMGKHQVTFTKHIVAPIHVVVTNTDKIIFTGRKETQKKYRHHTGYPGALRERTVADQRQRDSCVLIANAVEGMLPKNNLRAVRMKQLHLYAGDKHPHQGQLSG